MYITQEKNKEHVYKCIYKLNRVIFMILAQYMVWVGWAGFMILVLLSPRRECLMVLSEFYFLFIFFIFIFFILPLPRFPDDYFWPVTCHGHRKKCIVFRPRATPGWGRGAPQTPQNPPRKLFFFACVSEPQEHFWKKNVLGKKKSEIFRAPLPPNFFFLPRNIS